MYVKHNGPHDAVSIFAQANTANAVLRYNLKAFIGFFKKLPLESDCKLDFKVE